MNKTINQIFDGRHVWYSEKIPKISMALTENDPYGPLDTFQTNRKVYTLTRIRLDIPNYHETRQSVATRLLDTAIDFINQNDCFQDAMRIVEYGLTVKGNFIIIETYINNYKSS